VFDRGSAHLRAFREPHISASEKTIGSIEPRFLNSAISRLADRIACQIGELPLFVKLNPPQIPKHWATRHHLSSNPYLRRTFRQSLVSQRHRWVEARSASGWQITNPVTPIIVSVTTISVDGSR
jgi:hypothetical protein